VRSTAAPYTESRLTRSVANERVGFPVVEQVLISFVSLVRPYLLQRFLSVFLEDLSLL
jgi:hypothetical protein